jgi:hypothetical protein
MFDLVFRTAGNWPDIYSAPVPDWFLSLQNSKHLSRLLVLCAIQNSSCFVLILIKHLVRQFRTHKVIYRRYAGLFFSMCVDITDNELAYLESIHLFVEILDHFFSNVCELDLVFNFHKVQLHHWLWVNNTNCIWLSLGDGNVIHRGLWDAYWMFVVMWCKSKIFNHWLTGIFDIGRVYSCWRIARNQQKGNALIIMLERNYVFLYSSRSGFNQLASAWNL